MSCGYLIVTLGAKPVFLWLLLDKTEKQNYQESPIVCGMSGLERGEAG